MSERRPRPHLSRDLARDCRAMLRAAGFDEAGVAERLEAPKPEREDALGTLIELFVLSQSVSEARLAHATSGVAPQVLAAAHLITLRDGAAHPLIALIPHRELLLASDPEDTTLRDYVMGVSAGTMTLEAALMPSEGGRWLDLGTGCGALALVAARDASEVVAVDLNPRALELVELNAVLNGVHNVTTSVGDMFAPDAELLESFDGVVCHPPCVISPRSDQLYCDAPGAGDAFMPRLLTACATLLRRGGVGQLLGNWADLVDTPWQQRLSGWLANTHCDAWVLANPMENPSRYAERWLADRGRHDADEHARWIADYDEAGVRGILSGLVTLRRPLEARPPWLFIDPAPPGISHGAGPQLRRGLHARDVLTTLSEDDVGGLRPSAPAELRQTASFEPSDDGWSETTCTTRLSMGLQYELAHDPTVGALIRACDGKTPFDDVVAHIAAQAGQDPVSFAGPAKRILRQLLHFGLLTLG